MKAFRISPRFVIKNIFNSKREVKKEVGIKIQDKSFRSTLLLNGELDDVLKFINCIKRDYELIDTYYSIELIKTLASSFPLKTVYKSTEPWISKIEIFTEYEYSVKIFNVEFTLGIMSPSGRIMEVFKKIVFIPPIWNKENICDILLIGLQSNEDDMKCIEYDFDL